MATVIHNSFHQDRQHRLQRRLILFLLVLCLLSWSAFFWLYFAASQSSICSEVLLPSPEKLVTYQTTDNCGDYNLTFPLEYTETASSSACINSTSLSLPSTNSTLNHLIFSLWWPPAVATGHPDLLDKARRHRKWLIRGLLTQAAFDAPPRQPLFPPDVDFGVKLVDQLSALMPNLAGYQDHQRYWAQVYNSWGRHSPFTPEQYLQAVVDLYLSPSPQPDRLAAKLNAPTFRQSSLPLGGLSRRGTNTGRQYLREIQLCVDEKLQLSDPKHCYYTDNICDRCRPFYFSSTLI
ncbi:hypothetical protein TYRP_003835 [Tyrophagus putrescentiae]|nr:hypothetical protein TYRP_003835 [Tyrophagus putrescentiae]